MSDTQDITWYKFKALEDFFFLHDEMSDEFNILNIIFLNWCNDIKESFWINTMIEQTKCLVRKTLLVWYHYDKTWLCDTYNGMLTHWGRVTHIYVSNLTIIGSDNGLWPGRCQAIIWINAGISLNGPLGTNFSEILIKILTFSFMKMHLKVSSAKWRPFCLGLNVLLHRYDPFDCHTCWMLS